MFTQCLIQLCSEEQRAYWLPLANHLNIIGCYAQTELGHGSNVADLETTATLDMKTDEFVLHTPTIRATKFWPGALGVVATHAVVFARLVIEESDYGV
jgi:acyl-CoA oxidase